MSDFQHFGVEGEAAWLAREKRDMFRLRRHPFISGQSATDQNYICADCAKVFPASQVVEVCVGNNQRGIIYCDSCLAKYGVTVSQDSIEPISQTTPISCDKKGEKHTWVNKPSGGMVCIKCGGEP